MRVHVRSSVVRVTVVDGNEAGSVVSYAGVGGPNQVLQGLTITNGKAPRGGGLSGISVSPQILDCIITANHATIQGGAIDIQVDALLCINPPIRRTSVQLFGGNPPPNDCSGSYSFDFNAYAQSGGEPNLTTGTTVYSQFWSRDKKHHQRHRLDQRGSLCDMPLIAPRDEFPSPRLQAPATPLPLYVGHHPRIPG